MLICTELRRMGRIQTGRKDGNTLALFLGLQVDQRDCVVKRWGKCLVLG